MSREINCKAVLKDNAIPCKASLGQTVIVTEGPEEYTGPVTVTPTEAQQTLQTNGKLVKSDISVGPIPSEYIIPTGTEVISVTENGTVNRDVTSKETVTVNTNVPIPSGYIIPMGNLEITENGQYDITDKASVNVDVPAPVPTGTIEITENGTYDVIDKALVQVNVPIPQPTGMKEISIMENGTVTEDVSDFASVEIFVTVPTYIQLTQAEYDALTVKDSDTLYVIMEGET